MKRIKQVREILHRAEVDIALMNEEIYIKAWKEGYAEGLKDKGLMSNVQKTTKTAREKN